jgi:hypothetical protein
MVIRVEVALKCNSDTSEQKLKVFWYISMYFGFIYYLLMNTFKPGSGHVGFCDEQKWRWGRFCPRTSFPLPICIPSASLESSSLSPEAGTIGQEWPQCQ